LWHSIIYGKSRNVDIGMRGLYRTGTDLSIPAVIEQYPQISQGQFEHTRTMERMESTEQLTNQPELIRVRLVADASGSMDEQKMQVLYQVLTLVLGSLQDFDRDLNITRRKTGSGMRVDTEAWCFGSAAHRIKPFSLERRSRDARVDIINILSRVHDGGATYDNLVLAEITDSLSEKERAAISSGKTMEIIFEITDGGSSAADDAREQVDLLSDLGVIVRAFQIGEVSADEKDLFNSVWNDERAQPLGQIVGSQIENLIPAVVAVLQQYLGRVRL
jgi:hypothetical protein